jgi:nitroreductase
MPDRSEANPQILRIMVERWSPRAFTGEAIPQADLDVMFEAAGWAPSAFNAQPWTFLYARTGDAHWDGFLSCLFEFNQGWARHAGVLVYVVSQHVTGTGEDAKTSHSHSFDAGAAWALLALQATAMGYHAHGMTGVDFDAAKALLGVPDTHRIEAAVAIGRRGDPATLPEPLQAREVPSGRKEVADIAVNGVFPFEQTIVQKN